MTGTVPTAVTETLAAKDLTRASKFVSYTLSKVPGGIEEALGYVLRHDTGELAGVLRCYDSFNAKTGNWESAVRIIATLDVYNPFPLWSTNPVEPGGPSIKLEKVDFLPSAGIMIATPFSHVLHWIRDSNLFTLVVERSTAAEARSVAELLMLDG